MLVTLHEAATLTGHDYKTLYNDRREGRYLDAVQDSGGRKTWRVPLHNLVSAGRLPQSSTATAAEEIAAAREARETRQLREALIRVEARLAASDALIAELRADKAQLQSMVATLLKKVA